MVNLIGARRRRERGLQRDRSGRGDKKFWIDSSENGRDAGAVGALRDQN